MCDEGQDMRVGDAVPERRTRGRTGERVRREGARPPERVVEQDPGPSVEGAAEADEDHLVRGYD